MLAICQKCLLLRYFELKSIFVKREYSFIKQGTRTFTLSDEMLGSKRNCVENGEEPRLNEWTRCYLKSLAKGRFFSPMLFKRIIVRHFGRKA